MTKSPELTRLADVAQLMLDHRLGQLRAVYARLDLSRMQLQAINAAAKPADLPLVAGEKVGLVYDRWADTRRAELNLVIARQTAEMIEARNEAGTAFGRLQALQGLTKQLEERR
jgi:hypothetical protein